MRPQTMTREARSEAARATRSPWFDRLARFGYGTKAFVYAMIGVLAVRLAIGDGGEATGAKGVVAYVAGLPFGKVLLGILAVGFAGLALYLIADGLLNLDARRDDWKGYAMRIGSLVSGAIYGALCVVAVRGILSQAPESHSKAPQYTAQAMQSPVGVIAVAVIGAIIALYGISQLVSAFRRKFERELDLSRVPHGNPRTISRVCAFGVGARGVVFAVMGGYLISAAVRHDPGKARGLGETLTSIGNQPYGQLLLAIAALGLVAYAVYALLQALYRHFNAEPAAAGHHEPNRVVISAKHSRTL